MLRIMEVPGSEMPAILSPSTIVNGHLTCLTDVHIDCEAFGKIESRKKIIILKKVFKNRTIKQWKLWIYLVVRNGNGSNYPQSVPPTPLLRFLKSLISNFEITK